MKINVVTLCSGYDSQCLALERLKHNFPNFDYELIAWAEFDPESKSPIEKQPAVVAHNVLFPLWENRNMGDITTCDWGSIKEPIDLLCYSTPCFVAGTLVQTSNGYKCIEDVKIGDKVLTHNRSFEVVEEIGHKPSSDLYKIQAMMFDEIVCTGEHPFYTRKMYRKWDNHNRCWHRLFENAQWTKAKDLAKDTYLGYAINTESKLPVWDGSIDNRWGHNRRVNKLLSLLGKNAFWYVMGRYVGDGWKRTNEKYGSGIVICCSGRNYDSLVTALNEIGLHYHQTNERTVTKLHISMNELNKFVDRYGYYAHGKKIDAETINLPIDLLKSFLDGVLDSDGCFDNSEYKITSVSRELVYGLQQCIAKVYHCPVRMYKCVRPKTTIIEGRTVNQRDTYTLAWHTDKRKQDKAFYENGYIWFPIKSVKKQDGFDVVYNIQVGNDHSYTANGAIVHNCQSISNAGLQAGFKEGSGTKSSVIWSVLNAIKTLRPKYLLMENVAAMVQSKFIKDFQEWQKAVETFGYTHYTQVLNSKDYGVPQNRERVFMISVRNDIGTPYFFPKSFKLQKRLKDVLEKDVDKKYYLSNKLIESLSRDNKGYKGMKPSAPPYDGIASCLTARMFKMGRSDNYVSELEPLCSVHPNSHKLEFNAETSIKPIAPALRATDYKAPHCVYEPQVEQIGNIVDDTNIGFKNPQRGRVYSQDGLAPCLNCCKGGGLEPKIVEYDKTNKTLCINSKVNGKQPSLEHRIYDSEGVSTAITTGFLPSITEPTSKTTYRIRKLTPRECFRLMGVDDSDIDTIQSTKISNSSQYKLAGNSITIPVLYHLFRKLFIQTENENDQLKLF